MRTDLNGHDLLQDRDRHGCVPKAFHEPHASLNVRLWPSPGNELIREAREQ